MTDLDETIALLENVLKRREQEPDHGVLFKDLSRSIAELKAERENERMVSQQ